METLTLPQAAPALSPSDADLLNVTVSLLSAMPGSQLPQPLSDVIGYVCSIATPEGRDRAVQLELRLAEYLNERHVLRTRDVSPAGLDAWAERAPFVVLHAAVVACARRHAGGAR
jgi:hypothetical protein